MRFHRILIGITVLSAACSQGPAPETEPQPEPTQRGDATFELPDTGPPAFAAGRGPVVGIDEAHQNYHTAGGRYRAFAELLRRDGYRVSGFASQFAAESLASVDLLVISNAISTANEESWTLPNPSAFTAAEIEALKGWVAAGGRLMLIADHMPMPGAAADLAAAFGVLFHDGFAYDAEGQGRMTFRREDGTLADHEVTRAAGGGEVPSVTTFMGQAFRVTGGTAAEPLLTLTPGGYMLLPQEAWEFSDATPRIPTTGLLQGVLVRHGAGRVAMFGEAAAFSAQVSGPDANPMGMNHPEAPHNARFLLNVIGWLTAAH